MATIINASNSSGLTMTSDLSGNLVLQTQGGQVVVPSTSGTMLTTGNAGKCAAWVSFNGFTGTIYSSYNISSVTRSGAGVYYATFTNALTSNTYAVVASCAVNGSYPLFAQINSSTPWSNVAPTTTTFYINTAIYNASGQADTPYYSAVVFST